LNRTNRENKNEYESRKARAYRDRKEEDEGWKKGQMRADPDKAPAGIQIPRNSDWL
jgi:hypothetical protein